MKRFSDEWTKVPAAIENLDPVAPAGVENWVRTNFWFEIADNKLTIGLRNFYRGSCGFCLSNADNDEALVTVAIRERPVTTAALAAIEAVRMLGVPQHDPADFFRIVASLLRL